MKLVTNRIFKNGLFACTLALGLSLTACSKKNVSEEGDVAAADTSGMQATDLAAGAAGGAGGAAGSGQKIPELGTVYFEFDSFALTSASKGTLDGAAKWLSTNGGKNVQIEGHTDERGTTEYNLALGERRAGSVKDYLVSKGVPATQLSTISYGEERPVAQGNDESAWAQNRRADFVSSN